MVLVSYSLQRKESKAMTKRLRQALERLEHLDPANQDMIADLIQQKLEEIYKETDAYFESPEWLAGLDKAVSEIDTGQGHYQEDTEEFHRFLNQLASEDANA